MSKKEIKFFLQPNLNEFLNTGQLSLFTSVECVMFYEIIAILNLKNKILIYPKMYSEAEFHRHLNKITFFLLKNK